MNLHASEPDEAKVRAMNALEVAINRGGWSLRSLYYSFQEKRYVCTLSRLIQTGDRRRRVIENATGHGETMCGAMLEVACDVIQDLAAGAVPPSEEGDDF